VSGSGPAWRAAYFGVLTSCNGFTYSMGAALRLAHGCLPEVMDFVKSHS
jgi:hypothetical protein